jgi:hypothetical protein
MKIKESRIIKDYLRSRTKDDYITKGKDTDTGDDNKTQLAEKGARLIDKGNALLTKSDELRKEAESLYNEGQKFLKEGFALRESTFDEKQNEYFNFGNLQVERQFYPDKNVFVLRKEKDGTLTELSPSSPDYHKGLIMMLNKINQE